MQNLIVFLKLLGITFSTYLENATKQNNVPTPKNKYLSFPNYYKFCGICTKCTNVWEMAL